MDPENSPTFRTRLLKGLAGLLLAFVIYVASYDPVRFYCVRVDHAPLFVIKFYAPVWWLYVNTPLGLPLEGYLGWWERLAHH